MTSHILEHEDGGMMGEFAVIEPGEQRDASPTRTQDEGMTRKVAPRLRVRPATVADIARVTYLVRAAYRPYVARLGGPPRPMTDDYAELSRTYRVPSPSATIGSWG